MRQRWARRIARLYGGAALYGFFTPVNFKKMIDKKNIKSAAQKWAIDTKKKFPHLSEPEFIAGAEWALEQVDPLCNDGANLIEKTQGEIIKIIDTLNASKTEHELPNDYGFEYNRGFVAAINSTLTRLCTIVSA